MRLRGDLSDRFPLVAGAALLALTAAIAGSLAVGAVDLRISELLREGSEANAILRTIRLPRVAGAAAIGAILAMCGLTFQTLLRNSLADPFILGVSGGAACGAALATATGIRSTMSVASAAFVGACLAISFVLLLARRHGATDAARLLLAGIVVNAFFSAVILVALSFTHGADLSAAVRWMMGGLAGTNWTAASLVLITAAAMLALLAILSSDIRLLAFGEEDAVARGVNAERVKLIGFLAASVATGIAVSVSGVIGFVGLIVPHGIRLLVRRDFRFLLPLVFLGGAALLVVADAVARTAIAPAELPVGALTALVGVPFFLAILRRAS